MGKSRPAIGVEGLTRQSKTYRVRKLMSTKEVTIYTSALCGYCHAAKKLLDGKGIAYTQIAIDRQPEKRQEMMDRSARRTVPQIFIGDHHVGGFDDLSELESDGELDALLAAD